MGILKKVVIGLAAVTGVSLAFGAVKQRIADLETNLKFFFNSFRIHGFVKDPASGKLNGNLRAFFDFTFYNYSQTALEITNLYSRIEYLENKQWYPIGISPVLVSKISIPAQKAVPVKNIAIDFNIVEIVMSNLANLFQGKEITIRITNKFNVYGVPMTAPPYDYKFKIGKDSLAYITEIFKSKKNGTIKGLGMAGIGGVVAANAAIPVIPIQTSDAGVVPGTASGGTVVPETGQKNKVVNGLNYAPSGMGFVAQKKRTIKSGAEYDHLIERSNTQGNAKILGNGSVPDTLKEINRIVKESSWQVRKLAQHLNAGNPSRAELCKRIYDFMYQHIDYKEDETGKEQLRQPGRLWADRKGDCDCFSIFAASILRELSIPCDFRVVKMHNRDYFQHIYVIVPAQNSNLSVEQRRNKNAYYVIDPVMDYANADPEGITYVMDVPRS